MVAGGGRRKHSDRCRTSLFKHRGQGNKWAGEQRLNTQRCGTSSHQSRLSTIKSMFKLSLLKSLYFVNFTSVIHAQHIFGCFLQTDPRSLQGSQHDAPSRICGLLIINQQSGSIVRSNERLVCHFDFILYRSDWIDDFYQPDTRHNICIMLKRAQPSPQLHSDIASFILLPILKAKMLQNVSMQYIILLDRLFQFALFYNTNFPRWAANNVSVQESNIWRWIASHLEDPRVPAWSIDNR